jgi:DNA-binding NarL/FixJ family response regulator
MAEVIKVLIADDHLHEREGLKKVLSLIDGIAIVGVADSAQEAVRQAAVCLPDVVIVDLMWYRDPGAGADAIRQIRSNAPLIGILAVTAYDELIEKARQAGADLAVHKDTLYDDASLSDRIRDVYRVCLKRSPMLPPAQPLTERELHVLRLMAQDKTDQQIAARLGISVHTTKKHTSSILSKLEVGGRGGAIAKGYELGYIHPGSFEAYS